MEKILLGDRLPPILPIRLKLPHRKYQLTNQAESYSCLEKYLPIFNHYVGVGV